MDFSFILSLYALAIIPILSLSQVHLNGFCPPITILYNLGKNSTTYTLFPYFEHERKKVGCREERAKQGTHFRKLLQQSG